MFKRSKPQPPAPLTYVIDVLPDNVLDEKSEPLPGVQMCLMKRGWTYWVKPSIGDMRDWLWAPEIGYVTKEEAIEAALLAIKNDQARRLAEGGDLAR